MTDYDLGAEVNNMLRERLERILKRHGISKEKQQKILFEMYGPE